ncbi:uncharacterized protein LOC118455581 [Neolamprologus brichardi]|uniref:uncharacterized protein LOC118455581 n=1 Tax=Neolamprologus brichardi TaxID=32507 RepID=UPI0016437454|nr:uncharacterized protein LOC118455581 [Neolamprologus brichardi]
MAVPSPALLSIVELHTSHTVASAILYSLACCMLGQQVEGRRSNRFNKLIRMASNGVGIELDWLKVVLEDLVQSSVHQESVIMAQVMFALFALFLVSVCTGQDFCAGKCPHYKVLETYPDFEVRLYDASTWITTKIDSSRSSDVLAANSRLKDYAKKQTEAGFEISSDTWPALVKVTDGKGDPEFSLSWFIPPGTTKPENSDPLVQLESKPEATLYVR